LPAFLDQQNVIAVLMGVFRQCVWLVLLAVIFLPLERLFAVRPAPILRKAVLGDTFFYFINGIVPALLLAPPLSIAAYAGYYLIPWRVHHEIGQWPIWLSGLAAFVVGDLGFYWGHRWTHRIPFLWRFHSVHHAPEHMYFLISARAHPFDNVFVRLCGMVPVFILGIGAPESVKTSLVATMVMLITTVWGFYIHSNIRVRLGPLEWLLSTPAFHHWHHTLSEPRDRNFASSLPCWDWIFGTWHLPRNQWPSAYGVEAKLPSSVTGQLLYPLYDPPRAPVPQAAE
jgi:sterol desaturase/sphingolipid hydroxylase (fatty acid hydroxylase superfamily)